MLLIFNIPKTYKNKCMHMYVHKICIYKNRYKFLYVLFVIIKLNYTYKAGWLYISPLKIHSGGRILLCNAKALVNIQTFVTVL